MASDAGSRCARAKKVAIAVDCAVKTAIKQAADEMRAQLGKIGILVNNAGISPYKGFFEQDDELFDTTIRINL